MRTVCVPFRADTPERIYNWNRTRQQWVGWDVFEADSDGESFGRSQALNRAAALAGDWEIIVVADCDLLLDDVSQAEEALELAQATKGYVVCYDVFYYLTEGVARRIRDGRVPTPNMAYYSLTQIWGGMFAIHREAWDSVGGFDERLTTWGGEDGRFLRQLEDQNVHKDRVEGACYHLKHPVVPGGR
jgi:hypothetical protein